MDDWMHGRLVEAQTMNWKISIVRAIHGARADAWSVGELLAEYDRMARTMLTVERADGRTETKSEAQLRLEYERFA